MKLDGKVAVVTGAASGIGRALAIGLAGRGARLALSDIDEVGLAATAQMVSSTGSDVSTHRVDVADREQVFAWSNDVASRHGVINVLVNNAGVAMSAAVVDQRIEDFTWLMNINFWGVVHGTDAFLPHLQASSAGHVVNISSVFGLMSIPSQSAYNASKFAVRGYSDTLRMELEMMNAPVSVTTVHPGGIKTSIARNARQLTRTSTGNTDLADRFEKHLARTRPEVAAEQILRAVERNRRRALIGPDAPLFDLASRLPSAISQRLTMATARRALGNEVPDGPQERGPQTGRSLRDG